MKRKIEPGTICYYMEEGRFFSVLVLEDRCNEKKESYIIKILANLGRESWARVPELPIGTTFECMSARAYPQYKSWDLSEEPLLPDTLSEDLLDCSSSDDALTIGSLTVPRYLN